MKYMFHIIDSEGNDYGTIPATKKAAKAWVKTHILSTHMGYWRKGQCGYHYDTTIGKYLSFVKLPVKS